MTVGVMGVEKGVGTTHSSLMTASYYRKKGYSVAIVEWGEQEAFSRIRDIYEGGGSKSEEDVFVIKRIHHYPRFSEKQLSRLRKEGYQVIVVDFGKYQDFLLSYYNDLDLQLLVGHGIDWKIHELGQIVGSVPEPLCADWKILLPFGDDEERLDVQKLCNVKAFSIPFHKNPYQISKAVCVELNKIFMD